MLVLEPPEISLIDLSLIVRSEYLESPGLSLTKRQVQRLWALDGATCDRLLHMLISSGFLRRTPSGMFVKSDAAC